MTPVPLPEEPITPAALPSAPGVIDVGNDAYDVPCTAGVLPVDAALTGPVSGTIGLDIGCGIGFTQRLEFHLKSSKIRIISQFFL